MQENNKYNTDFLENADIKISVERPAAPGFILKNVMKAAEEKYGAAYARVKAERAAEAKEHSRAVRERAARIEEIRRQSAVRVETAVPARPAPKPAETASSDGVAIKRMFSPFRYRLSFAMVFVAVLAGAVYFSYESAQPAVTRDELFSMYSDYGESALAEYNAEMDTLMDDWDYYSIY